MYRAPFGDFENKQKKLEKEDDLQNSKEYVEIYFDHFLFYFLEISYIIVH
jgi:hypothetical protein